MSNLSSLHPRGLKGTTATDGVPVPRLPLVLRAHTNIRVIIHNSRISAPLDVSEYVVECRTAKNIQGVGQANIALVPQRNWLNLVNPNDYVNVYFNQNDGQGWVRTFFGLVDRIEENMAVGQDGTPASVSHIICSDFSKVIHNTAIYYNPYVGQSSKFAQAFKSFNVFMSAFGQGVVLYGTPGDVVANLLFTYLGFGNQFSVPTSYLAYDANNDIINFNRSYRRRFAYTMLDSNQRAKLGDSQSLDALVTQHVQTAEQKAADVRAAKNDEARTTILQDLSTRLGISLESLQASSAKDSFEEFLLSQYIASSILGNTEASRQQSMVQVASQIMARATSLPTANAAYKFSQVGILDLINIGSFVEREAMDGYTSGISIQGGGESLYSTIRSFSNEIANELFFDLRVMSGDANGQSPAHDLIDGSSFKYASDEISGNTDADGVSNMGVQYVPACVMREYPFGTVESIDGRAIQMSISDGFARNYGIMPVGALFSDRPNFPGRHVIPFPNINKFDMVYRETPEPAVKHLDVAVVSESEFMSTNFGKSDTDHFNIIELDSTSASGASSNQYIMQDIFPLVTPIHIVQHGVRPSKQATRYAWLWPGTSTPESRSSAGKVEEQSKNPKKGTKPPSDYPVHPPVIYGNFPAPDPKHPYEPRKFGGFNRSTLRWGYTRPATPRVAAANGVTTMHTQIHDGQDICAPVGTPVYAVLPGKVDTVGVAAGYGRYIKIRHKDKVDLWGNQTQVYTIYAHLGVPKYTGAGALIPEANFAHLTDDEKWGIAPGIYGDRYAGEGKNAKKIGDGVTVNAGDLIGYVGWTASTSSVSVKKVLTPNMPEMNKPTINKGTNDGKDNGNVTHMGTYAAHLHFEVLRVTPGYGLDQDGNIRFNKGKPVLGRGAYPAKCAKVGEMQTRPAFIGPEEKFAYPPLTRESIFEKEQSRSIDPIRFYQDVFGKDLKKLIMEGPDADASTPDPEDVSEVEDTSDFSDDQPSNADDNPTKPSDSDKEDVIDEQGIEDQSEGDKELQNRGRQRWASTAQSVDTSRLRQIVARFGLLQDHWYQHNIEYLSGSINMRGAPEIRVGYRLDIAERNMSAYVESVNHQWRAPHKLTTSLTVTRGQPNNPYPVYVLPISSATNDAIEQRGPRSRLASMMIIPDPVSIHRSRMMKSPNNMQNFVPYNQSFTNSTDLRESNSPDLEKVMYPGEGAVLVVDTSGNKPGLDAQANKIREAK